MPSLKRRYIALLAFALFPSTAFSQSLETGQQAFDSGDFASALNEIGLPAGKFYTSVIAFNAGVEVGQITVITILFGCIIIPLRNKNWYRSVIVYPLSACIALVAFYCVWHVH